jgi:peptidoglycan/LPS O-acetylase OafA/YrhL
VSEQVSRTIPRNAANRFAHIDAMRAFAVGIVVFSHAGLEHLIPGGSGVTIFFAISGFVITQSMLRTRDKTGGFDVGGFYFRRIVKIFPPFAIAIILPTLVWSFFGQLNWGSFVGQILFVFNWIAIGGETGTLPGTGVVWSLAIEEQFYIMFALVWLLLVKRKHYLELLALVGVVLIVWSTITRYVLSNEDATVYRISFGTDTRIDGILFGVLAAVLYRSLQTSEKSHLRLRTLLGSNWALFAAVALYFVSLVIRDEYFRSTARFTLQSLAACLVILWGMVESNSELKRRILTLLAWRPIQIVGLASYSIYLVHFVVIQILFDAFPNIPTGLAIPLFVLIGSGIGIGIYYAVEVPILKWRVQFATHKRAHLPSLKPGNDMH